MKKIIAVDVDGTLVDSNKNLSITTKNALLLAQKFGHIVVIVTGRHPKGVEKYAKELAFDKYNSLVSGFNGAYICNFKSKDVIFDKKIDYSLMNDYLKVSRNLDCHHLIYIDDKIYTNVKDSKITLFTARMNNMEHFYKDDVLDDKDLSLNDIVLCHEDSAVMDKTEKILRDRFDDKLNIVRSTKNYLEAMPKGVNKSTGIFEIGKYYNVSRKDIIAFGDELNDFEMIRDAGCGVAMGNANTIIKDIADYITLSNDEDGIAYYLKKFNIIW